MAYEEELSEAVRMIKAGDRDGGSKILHSILRRDIDNERAWLWLSACVKEPEEKRECLERVLHLNPINEQAAKALAKLPPAVNPSPVISQPPVQPPPFSTTDFGQDTSPASTSPSGVFQWGGLENTVDQGGASQGAVADTDNFSWMRPSTDQPAFSADALNQSFNKRPTPAVPLYEIPAQYPAVVPASSEPIASINNFSAAVENPAWKKRAYQAARPWYRSDVAKILFYLFLNPVWALIVITDGEDPMWAKVVAGITVLMILAGCLIGILAASGMQEAINAMNTIRN